MNRTQRLIGFMALPFALVLCVFFDGPQRIMRTSAWMLVEFGIALLIALALGFSAALIARPKVVPYLHQFVSRGVELTAALPMVLACGVLAIWLPVSVPVAVAAIIGILCGLRWIRMVAALTPHAATPTQLVPSWTRLQRVLRPSLAPILPTIAEQLVGLEAAMSWLGFFDQSWSGGWGAQLGLAARRGQLLPLTLWTITTACLSIGLKTAFWRRPSPGGDSPGSP